MTIGEKKRRCVKATKVMTIAFALMLTGCYTRLANFTVLSNSNLDFEHFDYEVDKSRRVTGLDVGFIFAVIPFRLPDATAAVKNALDNTSGCVGLANVGVTYCWFWLGLGCSRVEVEGYPILVKGDE